MELSVDTVENNTGGDVLVKNKVITTVISKIMEEMETYILKKLRIYYDNVLSAL